MKKKITIIKSSKESLGIIIPKMFCEILQLEKGEKIEIEIKNLKSNELTLRKIIKKEE